MNEQQYIKGFNHGYLLSQHEPELLNQLCNLPSRIMITSTASHPVIKSMKLEKTKQHSMSKSQSLHNKDHNKDVDTERER